MGSLIYRTAILAFVWWVLTNGAADSWLVGVPAIAAAVAIDLYLFRSRNNRLSLGGSIAFVIFFLKSSISSGLDVTRRTYHPRLPMAPDLIDYPLKLTSPAARRLFVCTISLLPGTLSAGFDGHNLVIHALDVGRPVTKELAIIESRVAAVFKEQERTGYFDTGMD